MPTQYIKCSKCGRKGVYYSNRDAVRRATARGFGTWKIYRCRYCGKIHDRVWHAQYRLG